MSPKEKAYELVDHFVGFKLNPYNDIEMSGRLWEAKRNATFTADEVINSYAPVNEQNGTYWSHDSLTIAFILYWEEVKEEILKIGKE